MALRGVFFRHARHARILSYRIECNISGKDFELLNQHNLVYFLKNSTKSGVQAQFERLRGRISLLPTFELCVFTKSDNWFTI